MPLERRRSTDLHIVNAEVNDLIVLSSAAKEIRREAQMLVNISDGITGGSIPDTPTTRETLQASLDAISITIRALQKRFNR